MNDVKLIDAVKSGNYATAQELINGGADVNQQDEQGWTPLNFAAGKGDLSMVRLLVENGADIFKVGRDRRTPYKIALAAGRVSVVKYLREREDEYPGEKPPRSAQKYCKAYRLGDLRRYHAWSEGRVNWKNNKDNGDGNAGDPFPDDKLIFIHQDFTVTEAVYHDENVIFDSVDSAWREFCTESLNFRVPDDLDLIIPSEATTTAVGG